MSAEIPLSDESALADVAPRHARTSRWVRPRVNIYEDNYGFGVNSYQPMIDYLDEKHKKGFASKPKLPTLEERAVKGSAARRLVRSYSEQNLKELFASAERNKPKVEFQYSIGAYQPGNAMPLFNTSSSQYSMNKKFVQSFKPVEPEPVPCNREEGLVFGSLKLRSQANIEELKHKITPDFVRNEFEVLKAQHVSPNTQADFLMQYRRKMDTRLRTDTYHSTKKHEELMDSIKLKSVKEEDALKNALARVEGVDSPYFRPRAQSVGPLLEIKEVPRVNYTREVATRSAISDEVPALSDDAKYWKERCKRHSVEMEQLNIRVVEAETKLRTEITRIKKKYQCTITELELTIDVANKNNICLQQTVKKQSLSLAELQGLYEEAQRGLQMALDQLSATNRRVQSLQAELDEAKSNLDNANRAKRQAEIHSEELVIRVNELTNINVTISSTKIKLEQELNALASDYDEVSKELKMCDDRAQKAQNEAKHAIEILHEEQERVVKIESIKKSLEIEIKNLTIRLEEVESSTLVNSKRIISKLEARVRDIEIELDEERRRHAETVKILRKKERQVKEYQIQGDEDHKNISLLQESVDKLNEKIKVYKRQLNETEGMSQSNLTRVRRFQRELEAAEERADSAETNLNFVRAKHRTFVTAIPGGQTTQTVYVTEESSRVINDSSY